MHETSSLSCCQTMLTSPNNARSVLHSFSKSVRMLLHTCSLLLYKYERAFSSCLVVGDAFFSLPNCWPGILRNAGVKTQLWASRKVEEQQQNRSIHTLINVFHYSLLNFRSYTHVHSLTRKSSDLLQRRKEHENMHTRPLYYHCHWSITELAD